MRRAQSAHHILGAVLLALQVATPARTATAEPIVSHPLPAGEGRDVQTPALIPAGQIEGGAGRPTARELGLGDDSAHAATVDVSAHVQKSFPTERVPASEIRWLAAAKTDRRLRTSSPAPVLRKPIPEPASVLLLVTGLIGYLARRRLLCDRAAMSENDTGFDPVAPTPT